MSTKKSDCEVVGDVFNNVFKDIDECFERVIGDEHSKISVAKGVFGLGKSLTKLTFTLGGCVIKQTPKVIVMIADKKQEFIEDIENSMNQAEKKKQEEALMDKIKSFQVKQLR